MHVRYLTRVRYPPDEVRLLTVRVGEFVVKLFCLAAIRSFDGVVISESRQLGVIESEISTSCSNELKILSSAPVNAVQMILRNIMSSSLYFIIFNR